MKENEVVLIGSDQTWREQYLSTFRRSEFLEPEKALLAALLQDAIDCFTNTPWRKTAKGANFFVKQSNGSWRMKISGCFHFAMSAPF
jgi:hypothetical protein